MNFNAKSWIFNKTILTNILGWNRRCVRSSDFNKTKEIFEKINEINQLTVVDSALAIDGLVQDMISINYKKIYIYCYSFDEYTA